MYHIPTLLDWATSVYTTIITVDAAAWLVMLLGIVAVIFIGEASKKV